jgi:hypothetical protein
MQAVWFHGSSRVEVAMNVTDWIMQKTGMTQAETEQVLFLLLFVGGVLGLVFCHWWSQPPKRKTVVDHTGAVWQESQPSKKIQPIQNDVDRQLGREFLAAFKDQIRLNQEAQERAIKQETHVQTAVIYDPAGRIAAVVCVDYDNQETSVMVSGGYYGETDSDTVTVTSQKRSPVSLSSVSSPEKPSTFANG